MDKVYSNLKHVGDITGDTFTKRIRGSRHILRKPLAICTDATVLHNLMQRYVKNMVVIDIEKKVVYSTTLEKIDKKGFILDKGYGVQVGLALNEWDVDEGTTPKGFWTRNRHLFKKTKEI
jgi:hypothetical protein